MPKIQCIKNVSVTGRRCTFPAKMAEDCMLFMCDNLDYTHFFSYKEMIEFESLREKA